MVGQSTVVKGRGSEEDSHRNVILDRETRLKIKRVEEDQVSGISFQRTGIRDQGTGIMCLEAGFINSDQRSRV